MPRRERAARTAGEPHTSVSGTKMMGRRLPALALDAISSSTYAPRNCAGSQPKSVCGRFKNRSAESPCRTTCDSSATGDERRSRHSRSAPAGCARSAAS